MPTSTLLITSSARTEGSVTRKLAEDLAARFGDPVTVRDVSAGLPVVQGDWLGAQQPGATPTAEQAAILAQSDALVAELQAHDRIIVAVPVYNFGVPAALKAWMDLVARPGKTFRYTETGPVGLLQGKEAYVVMASGGTGAFGDGDFATPHLVYFLGFIGLTDVETVTADGLMMGAEARLAAAEAQIRSLAPAQAA